MAIGSRVPGIDALRGIAIALVLLHHFAIAYPLPGPALVRAVTRNGNYGVVMFFAVSGFLVTDNARRRWGGPARISPFGFWRLRVARILPGLLLLLGLVEALGWCGLPIFARNRSEGGQLVPAWLVNLSVLSCTVPVLLARFGWVNYALCVCWSLSVEEAFYLVFPLAARLLRRALPIGLLLAALLVIGPCWRLAHADDDAGFLYAYPACFDAIAIGVAAAALSARHPGLAARAAALRVPVALGMAALYLSASIWRTNSWGVSVMAAGAASLCLAATVPGAATALGTRAAAPLRAAGRLSYELYLFHLVVLGLLRGAAAPETASGGTRLLLLAPFLFGSALLAILVSRCWNEPLRRRLRGDPLRRPRTVGAG